jgi:hypothetical protein
MNDARSDASDEERMESQVATTMLGTFFGAAAKEEREGAVLVLVLASKKIRRGQLRFQIAAYGGKPANGNAYFYHEPWQGRV